MKPLLFIDFDGVLCHDRFWRGLSEVDYERIQEFLIRKNRSMVERWMRGGHTSEEINQLLAEELGIPYELLWSVFVEDAKTMHIPKELLDALVDLRELYQIVLVTVNADCFDRFTIPALSLDTYFDLIMNSYTDGRFKFDDNGAMFIDAAKELKAPLTDAVLIDDRENNCAVFRQLGGKAFLVDKDHSTLSYLELLKQRPLYE